MGLFGGKDNTKNKIEELKAKMQQGGPAPNPGPQQQAPQQQFAPPQQPWQQPQQAPAAQAPPQQPAPTWTPPVATKEPEITGGFDMDELATGIVLDLGDGMSLNLPIQGRMRLDEFLRIADRVRELKKIDTNLNQNQNY